MIWSALTSLVLALLLLLALACYLCALVAGSAALLMRGRSATVIAVWMLGFTLPVVVLFGYTGIRP